MDLKRLLDEKIEAFWVELPEKWARAAAEWLGEERASQLSFRIEGAGDARNMVISGPEEIRAAFNEARKTHWGD